ncbi:unnamed protein product, partial [Rotaria magnacalcarata]
LGNCQTWNKNHCGRRPLVANDDIGKVVGGFQSAVGDWPWSVSVNSHFFKVSYGLSNY